MDQPWTQLGTSLVPTWIRLGFMMGILWPILEPTGSFMDLTWVPKRPLAPTWTLLFLHPLRVLVMGPNWTHPGTTQIFARFKFWVLEALKGFFLELIGFFMI